MEPQTRTARTPRGPLSGRGRAGWRGAGAAGTAVLIAVSGALLTACTGPDDGDGDGTAGSVAGGSADPAGTAGSATTDGTGGPGDDDGTGDAGTADSESKPKVPPRSPEPTTLPGLDGIQATDTSTLTGALPATASARGGLVTGFPEQVLPADTALEVVSSSVSAEGSRLQIGLEAGTGVGEDDVRAAFTATLEALGFTAQESPALPGDQATAYVHGGEGLVLTTRDRTGGGTELSVAGTLETTP